MTRLNDCGMAMSLEPKDRLNPDSKDRGGAPIIARGPQTRVMRAWGNAPGQEPPKDNPKRQRRGPISQIIERRMLDPDRATKPLSGVSKNTDCCRQGTGPNSTSVLAGIEMERAFSALASPVRT